MSSSYLTVAIPYVNAAPHLGYAYELVLADIAARARRAEADTALRFLGGTDDYSLKNATAAAAAGVATAEFVATNARRFAELAGPLRISFDDFIQTSRDPRHIPAVQRLWEAVAANGDLYRRAYQGLYCLGCEAFYSPEELVNGRCPEHDAALEIVEEENWFFRLSRYRDYLEDLITSGQLSITPAGFRSEVLAFLRSGLEDISVSRSAERSGGWGIPVPGDPSQVIYVWFDALVNYISALGYGEAAGDFSRWWTGGDDRIHVIGKGITRFHAIYWPAFLAAAGEVPPTRIVVHPYLTVDGAKLSKSSGPQLSPTELCETYGADALRWWFAREVHPSVDTDFTKERLVQRANEDLAGGLGNLVSRITTLIHRHGHAKVVQPDAAPLVEVEEACDKAWEAYREFQPRDGCELVLEAVAAANRELERTQPWQLAQDPTRAGEFDEVVSRLWTSCVRVTQAVAPVVPDLSARLAGLLAADGGSLPSPEPAFRRLPEPAGSD